VIGEIFDRVYAEAGTRYSEHIQTTLVPAGGAAIVEFKVEVPGSYKLVDHSILRAFNKGALGELKVEGQENKLVYSGKQAESDYHPTGAAAKAAPSLPTKDSHASGEPLYKTYCMGCHQAEGQGIPGAFPPLAKSDYVAGETARDRTRAQWVQRTPSGERGDLQRHHAAHGTSEGRRNRREPQLRAELLGKFGRDRIGGGSGGRAREDCSLTGERT
ncbi:MAG TPA: c-type cytochrome, partial [Nitrospira sp.]|nr:c-type cytochrome [Nitrospira sp.]